MAEADVVMIAGGGRNGRTMIAAPDFAAAFAQGKRVRTKMNGVVFDVTVDWWTGAVTYAPIPSGVQSD